MPRSPPLLYRHPHPRSQTSKTPTTHDNGDDDGDDDDDDVDTNGDGDDDDDVLDRKFIFLLLVEFPLLFFMPQLIQLVLLVVFP